MKSIFQLKTRVALVTGLNLTFHNIELNTIMQNVLSYIVAKLHNGSFIPHINENTSLGKVCRVISN